MTVYLVIETSPLYKGVRVVSVHRYRKSAERIAAIHNARSAGGLPTSTEVMVLKVKR